MIVLGFCSCQKELPQTDETPAEVDVYVAGYVSDDANYPYPVYNPYLQEVSILHTGKMAARCN